MNASTHIPPTRSTEKKPWFDSLISAHPSIEASDERRKSELLSALSLGFLVLVALGLLVTWLTGGQRFIFIFGFAFSIVAFFSYLLSRTSRYLRGGYLFVIGFSLLSYLTAFFDQVTPALTLMLTLSLAFLLANLLNLKQMVILIGVNLAVVVVFTLIFLPPLHGQELVNTLGGITAIGLFVLLFAWQRNALERLRLDEILKTQTSLEQSNLELQNAQAALNIRLTELRLAAEVGRTVSQVRALDVMLTDAAELIRKQFDLYYVQVYLTDPSQTNLNLQAGTGEVGRELLNRRHRLPLNANSINGRAAIEKRSVVVADTTASAIFKPNPLLPDTRSEMAIPLMIGDKVVGVLNMQSSQPDVLTEESLSAFEALAGQLAIAIQNARLLAEAEESRSEIETQAKRLTRENWLDYLDAIHMPERSAFLFTENRVEPLPAGEAPFSENALAAPIEVTGERLGSLMVEVEAGSAPLKHAGELVNAVARQVAQQIEALRLLESAERYRAEAEQASRRLTHEGWQDYLKDQKAGYIYDLKEVRPYTGDEQTEAGGISVPLKARDATIGQLILKDVDPNDSEAVEIASAVAERLGAHIEGLRLSAQTQQALAQTEELYTSTSQLSTAQSYDDVLELLRTNTILGKGSQNISINTFNRPWTPEQEPDWIDVLARWSALPAGAVSNRYPLSSFPSARTLLRPDAPVLIEDLATFPDIDENARALYTQRFGAKSTIFVPLVISNQWFGYTNAIYQQHTAFPEAEVRRLMAMSSQAAVIINNLRLLNETKRQAEREAMLNTISQKIQSATSVEAVLQIAARELGHALGAPRTIAQLSMKDKN